MITAVRFTRGLRDVFKKGQSFEIRPLTLLVGDNGTGKSTFLECLADAAGVADGDVSLAERILGGGRRRTPSLKLSNDDKKLERFIFADFEKDNCRVQSDFDRMGPFGAFSLMSMSHGESLMDEMEHGFSELKSNLVLLDEPDQCLSPRSAYRLYGVLKRMVDENGCQVICSCHSVPLMECAGEVLSLEHGKWMNYADFLASQKEPRPLRWVDKDERYCNYEVKVRLSNGEELYYACTGYGVCRLPFCKRECDAKEYRTRDAAQKKADSLAGRNFVKKDVWGKGEKLKVVAAEVVLVNRSW